MSDANIPKPSGSESTDSNSPVLQGLTSSSNINANPRGGGASSVDAPYHQSHEPKIKIEDATDGHNLDREFEDSHYTTVRIQQAFMERIAKEEQRLRDAAERFRREQEDFYIHQQQVRDDQDERERLIRAHAQTQAQAQSHSQVTVHQPASVAVATVPAAVPNPIVQPTPSTPPSTQAPPPQQPSATTTTSSSPTYEKFNDRWFAPAKSFTGDAASKAQEWLCRMKMYIIAHKIPPAVAPMVAMSFMDGLSSKWGANRCERVKNTIDSWELFEADFRATYLPVTLSVSSRITLQSLRMQPKQTALEFIQQFDALLADIPDMDTASQISSFIMGLNPQLRAEVIRARCNTLERAKEVALETQAYANAYGLSSSSTPSSAASINMFDSHSNQDSNQSFNFISGQNQNRFDRKSSSGKPRPNYYCSHCKMEGHSDSRCWFLHPEFKRPFAAPSSSNSNYNSNSSSSSSAPSKK